MSEGVAVSRLAGLLRESEAKALLVVAGSSKDPDMAPWAGDGSFGASFVVAGVSAHYLGFLSPIEREEAGRSGLSLLTPERLEVGRAAREAGTPGELWAAVLARGLAYAGIAPGTVLVAGHSANGPLVDALTRLDDEGWSFRSGNEICLRVRKAKRIDEVREVREVALATVTAFERVATVLAASSVRQGELWWQGSRLRVGDLRREVAVHFAACGLTQPEGNLLAPGREGAVPHNVGRDDSVVSASRSLIVDLFPCRRLFADCTRTFCVGPPPPRLVEVHAAVLEALGLAHSRARAGARGWDVQRAVCESFESRGHPTVLSEEGTTRGYVHGLGHGVGYEVHEYPEFRREASPAAGRIERGDVLTLEPGLYYPEEEIAVRLEDLCLVTDDGGSESLTELPYDLDPRAWPAAAGHGA